MGNAGSDEVSRRECPYSLTEDLNSDGLHSGTRTRSRSFCKVFLSSI